MNTVRVRPFHRRDRQQLADLVNAHAAAVVPGMRVSVSTVLSELERQSREFIVDPWVSERVTLVAEQHDRVAAAAHLLRFSADERVGKTYRGAREIHWLLFWPEAPAGNPYWPEQWPHIRSLYERAGFTHTGHTEIVYLAQVADLLRPAEPPITGLALRRTVGMNGTRLSAVLGEEVIGYIEVGTFEEGEPTGNGPRLRIRRPDPR